MHGPFSGIPVAVTSPALFLALGGVAVIVFLLLNGGSVRVRIHSPVAALAALAALWLLPHLLYTLGGAVPPGAQTVMRVEQSERWLAGRRSGWMLSLREVGRAGDYNFLLSGSGEIPGVDLASVEPGSCLRVAVFRLPGIVAVYRAEPAPCSLPAAN